MYSFRQFLSSWGTLFALFIALGISILSCKPNDDNTPTTQTIAETIANGNGGTNQFSLLNAALMRTGLNGALSQSGNYTLFAPTNAAFTLLGFSTEAAINTAPVDLLTQVLSYHVLNTKLESGTIATGVNTPQQTLGGGTIYITKPATTTTTSTTISVNGARIAQANIQASNGVIHVIDRVMLPPAFGNVVQTIAGIPALLALTAPQSASANSFSYLTAAVTRAGLVSSLTASSGVPITIFAPTDAAFTAAVPSLTSVAAVNALPVAQLQQILAYHVIPGNRLYTPLITNGASLPTSLSGVSLTAVVSTTSVAVRGRSNGTTASNITGPDVSATNGVIHIIDRLLMP
ncbi:fasciclin domain-containing protein [Spirosoma sp. KUDC1026]|uniref:fasciclin domain-containing protein n=1 Tax=Spirosoma sp. KUDC1026 TaxID=2745947 RepID=UPI00159BA995|nr:fasciclin domain-containing protein [Spirosoma sp. KUDC1026]QKZ14992.1 fasciclin domain-containing protein [Spirosoma sp. KUDC1026]